MLELKEFLQKNNITLPDSALLLCNEGIEIMRKSIDPIHDESHIFRILADLDRFLKGKDKINKPEINFPTLLLSICWHDVWKSKRFPMSIVSLLFGFLVEGYGSARLFTKRAKERELPKKLISAVQYAIRKHSQYQIISIKTIEAQILRDLDLLDAWSLEKLEYLKKRFLVKGKVSSKLLRLAKFYFDHFMSRMDESYFYLDWSKAEFSKRKKVYLKEVEILMKRYEDEL